MSSPPRAIGFHFGECGFDLVSVNIKQKYALESKFFILQNYEQQLLMKMYERHSHPPRTTLSLALVEKEVAIKRDSDKALFSHRKRSYTVYGNANINY